MEESKAGTSYTLPNSSFVVPSNLFPVTAPEAIFSEMIAPFSISLVSICFMSYATEWVGPSITTSVAFLVVTIT